MVCEFIYYNHDCLADAFAKLFCKCKFTILYSNRTFSAIWYICVCPMLCIQVGDTVGVSRHSDATMHVYINHRDLGPICSNISEVSDVCHTCGVV